MITNIKFTKWWNDSMTSTSKLSTIQNPSFFGYLVRNHCTILDYKDYCLLLLIYIFNMKFSNHLVSSCYIDSCFYIFLFEPYFVPHHANLNGMLTHISIFCPITITHNKSWTSMPYHICFIDIMLTCNHVMEGSVWFSVTLKFRIDYALSHEWDSIFSTLYFLWKPFYFAHWCHQ